MYINLLLVDSLDVSFPNRNNHGGSKETIVTTLCEITSATKNEVVFFLKIHKFDLKATISTTVKTSPTPPVTTTMTLITKMLTITLMPSSHSPFLETESLKYCLYGLGCSRWIQVNPRFINLRKWRQKTNLVVYKRKREFLFCFFFFFSEEEKDKASYSDNQIWGSTVAGWC